MGLSNPLFEILFKRGLIGIEWMAPTEDVSGRVFRLLYNTLKSKLLRFDWFTAPVLEILLESSSVWGKNVDRFGGDSKIMFSELLFSCFETTFSKINK